MSLDFDFKIKKIELKKYPVEITQDVLSSNKGNVFYE